MKELIEIQSRILAPKGQRNNFGGYNYRSAEDILKAVKPLLHEQGCILTIMDDIQMVGDRIYIKATARLMNGAGEVVETTAYAREEESKKGMDASQVTGAASSYARKYALNGLFAIDNTKDADALNTSKAYTEKAAPIDPNLELACQQAKEAKNIMELVEVFKSWKGYQNDDQFLDVCGKMKKKFKVND